MGDGTVDEVERAFVAEPQPARRPFEGEPVELGSELCHPGPGIWYLRDQARNPRL
jgi:hypothetical protein